VHGCDLEYAIREILMNVGVVPTAYNRGLDEKVAIDKFYKIMNIDLNSKSEVRIAKMIEDRGKANSSFEGENHFNFKHPKNFPNNLHNPPHHE